MTSDTRAKVAGDRDARRRANQRAAERARAKGMVQRSLTLPTECWQRIRAARLPAETSDAQTVTRLLLEIGLARADSLDEV